MILRSQDFVKSREKLYVLYLQKHTINSHQTSRVVTYHERFNFGLPLTNHLHFHIVNGHQTCQGGDILATYHERFNFVLPLTNHLQFHYVHGHQTCQGCDILAGW